MQSVVNDAGRNVVAFVDNHDFVVRVENVLVVHGPVSFTGHSIPQVQQANGVSHDNCPWKKKGNLQFTGVITILCGWCIA